MSAADPGPSVYVGADTRAGARDPDGDVLWDITFPRLVARQAQAFPSRELVVDGERRLSYADFEAQMTRVAKAAMALGVEPGDRVAVWAPNSAEWVVAALGASAAGAAILPMNSRFKGVEAVEVIERARPRLLFTTRRFLATDYPAMLRAATTRELAVRIVILDSTGEDGDLGFEEFLDVGNDVPVDEAIERRDAIPSGAVSDIILTSGTTGSPKGVMTTHGQNVLAWLRYINHLGLRSGERINVTLPFFHNFGLKAGFLNAVLLGGACVCDATFDPARLARLVETERISFLPGTPTLFAGLLASPARHEADLSSLRNCLVAGSMIPVELVAQMQAELCEQVITGYGLSELAAAISLTPRGAPAHRVAEWSGRVVEGVEVRVVGDDGVDVPRGQPGEILARSDCVMVGYMDNAAATAEAIDADGWLHTGDIGILDDEDYIRITDRKKDMFIVGGFNAFPAEIERLLLRHPAIAQVAVLGMPDERLGEVGAAFVVAEPGVAADAAEIIEWSRQNMSNFKVPRRVVVLDELPMNASMKVIKSELRSRLGSAPVETPRT